MTDNAYPNQYPACIMCGAKPDETCTGVTGTPRAWPHTARSKPGQPGPVGPFVAVRDEPNHYHGEPHTPQCAPDCPLPPSARENDRG